MKVVNDDADDWDDHIQPIAFAYRVNKQNSTKYSPFELMYGVKAKLPADIEKEEPVDLSVYSEKNVRDRILQVIDSLPLSREKAKDHIVTAQNKQKKRYDIKHSAQTYEVGEKVLKYNRRRNTRMGDKLSPRFTGPFEIVEILGSGTYRLKKGNNILKQTANGVNLKRWFEQSVSSLTSKTYLRDDTPKDQNIKTSVEPLTVPWWIKEFNLNENDKDILLSGEWLNDKIMDSVNQLVNQHLGAQNINQSTLFSQLDNGFQPLIWEGIQILHDTNHLVVTACIGNKVLYADSLNNFISDYVAPQIRQLYASHITACGNLIVNIVPCQLQPNMSDCGVFAAAFAFHWALGSTSLDDVFEVKGMRLHLAQCLERQEVIAFPTVTTCKRGRKRNAIVVIA